MIPKFSSFLVGLTLASPLAGLGQGTMQFQNLNFESANLPALPAGQYGGLVSTSAAIPGWLAYYGPTPTAQMLHNNYLLGSVNASILGPDWGVFQIIQGNFSVLLQSGLGSPGTPNSAAIAQTGTIPLTALSVQFMAQRIFGTLTPQIQVSIGGQSLPLLPLSVTANYTLYGADVSAYAGMTRELRIASVPAADPQYSSFLLDGIQFSDQAIPEPSAFGLSGLGALLLGCRTRRVARS